MEDQQLFRRLVDKLTAWFERNARAIAMAGETTSALTGVPLSHTPLEQADADTDHAVCKSQVTS